MKAMRPVRVLSLADLQKLVPDFTMEWLKTRKGDVRVLFNTLGVDTEYGLEIQEGLTHRSVLCDIVTCPRIVGHERIDKEWLKSGNASEEAMYFTMKEWL